MSVRATLALVRASWLTAKSYRVQMVLSIVALAFTVVPVFFVAGALQPVMARSIADEGAQAFGFLLLGSIAISLVSTAMTALPNAVSGGISSGFFEALLASPAPLRAILAGESAYALLWIVARGAVMLLMGWLLGVPLHWTAVPAVIVVTALLLAAYAGVGLVSTALVLAFRTNARVPQAVLVASILLGGAYYSTDVLPESLRPLSVLVPMTYGLRATRRLLLQGVPLTDVLGDVAVLVMFVAAIGAAGMLLFMAALRYARRAGSLSQY